MDIESSLQICKENQEKVKQLLNACPNDEARYQKIIELGRTLSSLDPQYKVPKNFVPGCQSEMYLHAWMEEGKVYFSAESDALISAGLAVVLIRVYSGLTPEAILKCLPDYLEELNLSQSLSPNRASGLYSIHLKMKQEALRFLMQKEQTE